MARRAEVHHPVVFRAAHEFGRVLLGAPFNEHIKGLPNHGLANGLRIGINGSLKPLQAGKLNGRWGVVLQVGGRCSRPGAVNKGIGVIKAHGLNEPHAVLKLQLAFPGKAHNEIGGQTNVGP